MELPWIRHKLVRRWLRKVALYRFSERLLLEALDLVALPFRHFGQELLDGWHLWNFADLDQLPWHAE